MATKAKRREPDHEPAAVPAAGAAADGGEPAPGAQPVSDAPAPVPVDALADTAMPRLVPLRKLKAGPENVRRGGKADVEQLAADIAAHGLIQNLVGTAEGFGAGEVVQIVAGGRRLKALELLKRQGRIDGDYLVPVQIVDAEQARELSLAENFQRLAMNPAEEAEAFHRLAQEGAATAEIAARFGLTELHVRQRLRLAGLHPSVLAALKAGKITLDVAKAFASVPDQARQAHLMGALSNWALGNPDEIRRQMRTQGLPSDSFVCAYVGEAAYLAAGGAIAADLFSNASTRLWLDRALAERLAEAKLAVDAEALREEAGLGGTVWAIYGNRLWDQTRALVRYSLADEDVSLLDLPADVRAGLVGAVQLTAAEDGYAVELDGGHAWLLDASVPVDPPAVEEPDEGEPSDEDVEEPAPPAEPEDDGKLKPLPQALRDALAMRKRDALMLGLLEDTRRARDVALFLLIERVMRPENARWSAGDLGTAIAMPYPGVSDPVKDPPWEGSDPDPLAAKLADRQECGHHQEWGDLPIDDSWRHLKSAADRFAAFLELPGEERSHWAAVALGRSLTAHGGAAMKDAIAASLGLTQVSPQLWRPTAENYFDRAGKARCLAFLEECCGAADFPALADWRKLKKAELSTLCEQLAAGEAGPISAALAVPESHHLVRRIVGRFTTWMPAELMFGGAK